MVQKAPSCDDVTSRNNCCGLRVSIFGLIAMQE
jgi:hypothetical protein